MLRDWATGEGVPGDEAGGARTKGPPRRRDPWGRRVRVPEPLCERKPGALRSTGKSHAPVPRRGKRGRTPASLQALGPAVGRAGRPGPAGRSREGGPGSPELPRSGAPSPACPCRRRAAPAGRRESPAGAPGPGPARRRRPPPARSEPWPPPTARAAPMGGDAGAARPVGGASRLGRGPRGVGGATRMKARPVRAAPWSHGGFGLEKDGDLGLKRDRGRQGP